MFDHYVPDPALYCPACGDELSGWQGKDGPCGLLVWSQGSPAAGDHAEGEESKLSPAHRDRFRLPPVFRIYTDDEHDHWIEAQCLAPDGVWRATEIVEVREIRTGKVRPVRPAG